LVPTDCAEWLSCRRRHVPLWTAVSARRPRLFTHVGRSARRGRADRFHSRFPRSHVFAVLPCTSGYWASHGSTHSLPTYPVPHWFPVVGTLLRGASSGAFAAGVSSGTQRSPLACW